MLNIAIVGCGKIADAHIELIQQLPDCQIVGVCDKEYLMAEQMADRFGIENSFNDIDEMLNKTNTDVVHITTPPQSHYVLGKKCLETGRNVYIEKPFTIDTPEAEKLVDLAVKKNLLLTVGHDQQFSAVKREMRKLVADGFLGGPPVHMESYYCYEWGDEKFAKVLLGDNEHWVRKLPGKIIQNIISHGISPIAEFLDDSDLEVICSAFSSGFLKKINEFDIIDELRVIITQKEYKTAYFTFSTQFKPSLKQFRLFGPENGLVIDNENHTIIKLRGQRYTSYLDKFIPPLNFSKQYLYNNFSNIKHFITRNFHMKEGMKYLINAFYESIRFGKQPPIPYREILITSKIMDMIFTHIQKNKQNSIIKAN